MRTIHRECVVGLIVSADGQILFGKKDPEAGGVYADRWHLPGGGVDEGEGREEALHREIGEEVGLDTNDAEVILFDDEGVGESEKTLSDTGETVLCKMKFLVYKIILSQPASEIAATPGDDIVQTQWVPTHKLAEVELTPPSVELFTKHEYLK